MGVKSGSGGEERRRYDSPLRSEQSRQTRRAIVSAASRLFVSRGYASASLADIAREASVARPTVFAAFGSKAALLRQVVDQALAGDDEAVPVAERPWFRPVWDARTPRAVLEAYAGVCCLIGSRAAAIFEVVRRAADEGPEPAELWETMRRNRRAGAEMVVRHAETLGPRPPDLDHERAVDVVWLFNDPAHYEALVHGCGWSERAYTSWIGEQMVLGTGLGTGRPAD
ncbi:TetR/AcrR family transcriptional regulator [Streptomyces sp. NPDC052225]|uniref:TetR/AcrR family transcriptional regulator n=1 Tax=Streptomyces sp. NPDC052225 TaxID=3154949 RepID=UPI00342059FB